MKNLGIILLLAIAAGLAAVQAQEKGRVIRLESALDEIVPLDTKVEKVAGNLVHVEGPVWVHKGGYLLCSDIDANVINKWSPAEPRFPAEGRKASTAPPKSPAPQRPRFRSGREASLCC